MFRSMAVLALVMFTGAAFSSNVLAAADSENYGNVKVSEVTSIYDGDTLRVNIAGWPSIIGNRISVRVKDIDTPELRGKCEQEKQLARKAKQATVSLLRNGKKIELRNLQRDKYFRLLADVYVDNQSLGVALKKAGLARTYHGGTKSSWCAP